jgi:long-chain fatty acid transport protein
MVKLRRRLVAIGGNIIWILIVGGTPQFSNAGGPVHGAKSAGMGTAFVAVADDPSAMAINPAGLTQSKGTWLYCGLTAVYPKTSFESPQGESTETEDNVYFPPHLYLSSQLSLEDWTFGLGLFSPFGIGGREWPEDDLTRYVSTESTITTFTANPTVAWQMLPQLSVAVGVSFMYARNFLKAKIDQSMIGGSDGQLEIEQDGTGWGYNLGLLYQPIPQLKLGLAYRSAIEIDQEGDATFSDIAPALKPIIGGSRFKTDVETTMDFPEVFSLGAAWLPSPKWVIALDYEWVGWSSFDSSTLDFENEIPPAGIRDQTQNLDWKDVWQIKVGIDYRLSDPIALRCGYAYVNSPVPERTLTPANPDANQHSFAVGFGYHIRKWIIDSFYTAGFFEDRTVENDILSGTYENFTHYGGISIGYQF